MESGRFVHRADASARLKKKLSSSRAGPHGERPLLAYFIAVFN